MPELDLDLERRVQEACLEAAAAGILASAHDVSDGGLAVALAEAALGGRLGVSALLEAEAPAEGERGWTRCSLGKRTLASSSPPGRRTRSLRGHRRQARGASRGWGVVTPEQDGFELRAEVRAAGAVRSAVIRASLADLRGWLGRSPLFLGGRGGGSLARPGGGRRGRGMSGVFGVYSPSPVEAADLTYLGLYALQHRGQESAGIAVFDGSAVRVHKGPGRLPGV